MKSELTNGRKEKFSTHFLRIRYTSKVLRFKWLQKSGLQKEVEDKKLADISE